MEDFKHLIIKRREGRVDIILNRPPVNVLNIEMMRELCDCLDPLAKETDLKVLTISAQGKAFSAGVDVSEHTEDKVEEMIKVFSLLFKKLWAIRALTIAVVERAALGGGCELAIGCDMIIASEKAKFAQPEIKVGVFPPIAAVIFPKLIGINRALEWILSGDVISAVEAEKIGLVNKVFPLEDFKITSDVYISKFISQSAAIISMTKRLIYKVRDKSNVNGVAIADEVYLNELMKLEDAGEGLSAFLEKRDPIWKNR